MTDSDRTERERAFSEAVCKQIAQGRFGGGNRRKLVQEFADDSLLNVKERLRFESHGQLPPRFLPAGVQPANPADYEFLQPEPSRFELQLTPPVQHDDGPLPLSKFARPSVRSFPTKFALRADGVTAYIQNYLSVYEVASGYIPEITDNQPMLGRATLQAMEQRRLAGMTANLVVVGSAMFSHWTFDVLPRFKLLRDRGFEVADFDHVLIASRNKNFDFHAQGLAALGVDPDQVQVVREGSLAFAFDTLVTPSSFRSGFHSEPWVYEEVRRLFMPKREGSLKAGKRLFIGRKGSNKRTIANMDAVQPVLDAFGFETAYAEDCTISDFAAVMDSATVVVGPHGAGMSNVVFCRPGARVLELYGAHITDEFWSICNTMGMEHHILAGHDAEGRRPWEVGAFPVKTQKERNAAGFSVDPAILRRTLSALC